MLFMIMSCLKKQWADLTEVKIVFFLPGYSYMPVDSIHATIERFINDKTIWAPSEWPPLIRNSRVNQKSIEVKEQQFQNFLNWKKMLMKCCQSPKRYRKKYCKNFQN